MPAKTERITVLGTPEFKAFPASEAKRQGIRISEFVRRRCPGQPLYEEQELLLKLADEVKVATKRAKASLERGLRDAERVIRERCPEPAEGRRPEPAKGLQHERN